MIRWRSIGFRSGVSYDYGVVEEKLETNREIENSPIRNMCSVRDRVWEPGDVKCNRFSTREETYCEGGI
jgi:hypothetical protein